MKSVLHEASSIAKAVEQAWEKAGRPVDFSIKILEHPQKNFIGFTTKSAKVALFFEEKTKVGVKQQEVRKQRIAPQQKITEQPQEIRKSTAAPRREQKGMWTPEMVSVAKQWLDDTLAAMNIKTNYNIEPSHFYLRISFADALMKDGMQERRLFASFATLMLETLKKTFKTGLRGHKIVLTHAQANAVSQR